MVNMDARHTGDHRLNSILRHFFKNSNQHLALQGPPGGQTVPHPLPTSTKPVENSWGGQSGGWSIRSGKMRGGQSGSGENNQESSILSILYLLRRFSAKNYKHKGFNQSVTAPQFTKSPDEANKKIYFQSEYARGVN